MSYKEIKKQKSNPSYVSPVTDYRLGWLAFADGLPIDEVQDNDNMRRGWIQALRDSANAEAGTVYA